jgi:RNA polymerase sigma-70 factor (ECF subfamily)
VVGVPVGGSRREAYHRDLEHRAGDAGRVTHDAESRLWIEQLRSGHPRHDEAVGRLHAVLVRVAYDELARRRDQLGAIAGPEYDDLAQQAADGALMNILRKLDAFRGLSRFTTWAFRFVISEVATRVARDAWRRKPPSRDELAWHELPDWLTPRPGERLEQREQLEVLSAAIGELSDRQREVFVAIALNDVSIDVLALQLDTNRAETYKHLFDARHTLREGLAAAGHAVVEESASA